MPKDDAKLKKALHDLSLALAKQSMERQKRETVAVKEIARILTRISKIVGDATGTPVEDIGDEFAIACNFGWGFPPPPKSQK